MVKIDFIVMAIFALLMVGIGVTFTRAGAKSGQTYFEAGGQTPWWINGLSMFISYFSAGTFVVWGSIAYKSGLVSNVIQLTMAISGLITAIFIADKWKKSGATTAAEYIGKRYGSKTQQFYTYLMLLYSLFITAAVLYPVGKMVSVTTPFSLNACIIVIGLIIVLYTSAGGLWAVLVTDVVQFVILTAAVLIVIPIAFSVIGGPANFVHKAPVNFFKPFNQEYTPGFMLAFIIYQVFYIGGNWAYVQRYTTVSTPKNAKKVAGLFTVLYFVSPFIWMIPPMIYRLINPGLQGLQTEDAYIMLIQRVMPAGLIGLVLAGMVSATSSKANTTINMAATVFAQDIYRSLIRKKATDKETILIARFFTLLFGIGTILIAIWIPSAGGIVEVVLSTASIAGSALFAPVIWTLFSKRQNGVSIVTATSVSLIANLFLKVAPKYMWHITFSRTTETVLGVGIPIFCLAIFEIYNRYKNVNQPTFAELKPHRYLSIATANETDFAAQTQNVFGIKVIAICIAIVGAGIVLLGLLATSYNTTVITVGGIILVLGGIILSKIKKVIKTA